MRQKTRRNRRIAKASAHHYDEGVSLLPPKEKNPPLLSFRCPSGLRDNIQSLAATRNYTQTEVIIRLLELAVELDSELASLWPQIEATAKVDGITPAQAVARLVGRGLVNQRTSKK